MKIFVSHGHHAHHIRPPPAPRRRAQPPAHPRGRARGVRRAWPVRHARRDRAPRGRRRRHGLPAVPGQGAAHRRAVRGPDAGVRRRSPTSASSRRTPGTACCQLPRSWRAAATPRDRGFKEVALSGAHGLERVARARELMFPLVVAARAPRSGGRQLRPDIEPTDMPLLQLMLGTLSECTRDVDPEVWRRYLGIVTGRAAHAARRAVARCRAARSTPEQTQVHDARLEGHRAPLAGARASS